LDDQNEIKNFKNVIYYLLLKNRIDQFVDKKMPSCHPLEMGSSWYARGCWYHSGYAAKYQIPWCFVTIPNSTLPCFSPKTSIAS
jgi:hypothetical protein